MATVRHTATMSRLRPIILALVDWACINVIYMLMASIGYGWPFSGLPKSVWLIINVAFIPVFAYFIVVHSRRHIKIETFLYSTLKGMVAFGVLFAAASFITRRTCFPVNFYVFYFFVCLAAVAVIWIIEYFTMPRKSLLNAEPHRAVIVGTGETATHIHSMVSRRSETQFDIIGFVGNQPADPAALPAPYLGDNSQLDHVVKEYNIDTLYLTAENDDDSIIKAAFKVADDNICRFFYAPTLSHIIKRNFFVAPINGTMPAIDLYPNPLQNPVNRFFKRAFDIFFSTGVILTFGLPILIPVAIAIKLSSPGPVFFKQKRTGYRGRDFNCYKFRTMKVNNESDSRAATKDDERKTRVGDFLRRTSIDELPQFWNVLMGDMSVVGPRPHMVSFTEQYRQVIGEYMVRLLIKPGITGWAQANGYRGNTDKLWKMEKRVESDIWYIENWSFRLDLKIILMTVIDIIKGDENAY